MIKEFARAKVNEIEELASDNKFADDYFELPDFQ
jgi:hypothetical protein